ncbi:MAG: hypothetical protein HeimC3_10520 [Candidatus Heimdallarchaeota archaeon LC_3]|nr:MAG: hypothetical protein HeimC3_10520 [Candidatus Heimdallarchaeota archaeon LC_3]
MIITMSQVDIKTIIKENKSEIEEYVKMLINVQKKLESNLKKTEKDFKNSFDHQKANLGSTLTSIIRDLESLIEKFNSDKNVLFKKDLEDFKRELAKILSNTKADTESSLNNIESVLSTLESETTRLLKSQSKEIAKNVSDVYSSEIQSIDILSETLTNSVDRLRSTYEHSVEQEIENLKSSTNIMYEGIIEGLNRFRNETSRITKIGEDKVTGTLEEAVNEIQSGFEGSISSLKDVMRSIETNVQKVFTDSTEEFSNTTKNISKNFVSVINNEKGNTNDLLNITMEYLNNFKKKELDSVSGLFNKSKSNFIKSLEINEEKMEKDFKSISNFFQNDIYNSLDKTSNSFQNFYDGLESKIDSADNIFSIAKAELDSQKQKLIDEPIINIQSIAGKMEEKLQKYFLNIKETFDYDKEIAQNEFESKLVQYQQEYSDHIGKINKDLMKFLQDSVSKQQTSFENIGSELKTFLQKSLEESTEILNKAYQGVRGDFSQFTKNQEQWQTSTSDDIARRLKEGKSRISMDLESIVPQIVDLTDNFKGNQEEVIRRAMTAMDSAVQLFKREDADESANAHSVIDTHMRDIEKRINNRQGQSLDIVRESIEEIEVRQKDIISKLKDELRSRFTNINDRYINAEEKIGLQTQSIFEKHNEISDSYVVSSQEKIQDMTKTSTIFQDKFNQITDKVDEDLSLALRNISTQVQNVTEKCNKIIDSSNQYLVDLSKHPRQPKQKTP